MSLADSYLKRMGWYTDLTFKDYVGTASRESIKALGKVILNYDKYKTTSIHIVGDENTQKTTMMKVFLTTMCKIHGLKSDFGKVAPYYVTFSELADTVHEAYFGDEDSKDKLKDIENSNVIIIDDFLDPNCFVFDKAKQKVTTVYNFINRLLGKKMVIFVSRYSHGSKEAKAFGDEFPKMVNKHVDYFLSFEDTFETEPKGAFDLLGEEVGGDNDGV